MRTLTLNIIKGYGLDPVLNVSQFDKGYTVACTVQKGAEAFTPPTGSTATVEGRKPDGTGYQYAATIDGATVTFTMAEQMTVLSGRSMAEIVFYDADSVRIGTANFYLLVEEAPLSDDSIISETDLPAIQQALDVFKNNTVAPGIITSASGDVAAFTDGGKDIPLTSLAVNIEPVQSGSGDPSPTNIRPISGWDEVNITRIGKNLLNVEEWERKNVFVPNADGSYTFNKFGTGTSQRITQIANVLTFAGTTVTFSADVTGTPESRIQFGFLNDSGSTTSSDYCEIANGRITATIPITADGTGARLYYANTQAGIGTDSIVLRNIQIEVNSEPTEYTPYAGETFPITLPTEAGTVYGGVVDPIKGKLTITHEYRRLTAVAGTGTSGSVRRWHTTAFTYPMNVMACDSLIASPTYKYNEVGYVSVSNDNRIVVTPQWAQDITTVADFNVALAEHPINLVRALATPIEYDLTPTQIKTLYGFNAIYADCGSIESVEYTADTKMYIDAKVAELQALILENA